MIARDTQRSRAYRAENTLPETFGTASLLTHEEGERFLASVLAREYVRRHYRAGPVALCRKPGRGARAGGGRIRCADSARTKVILLHELAHILDDREEWSERNRLSWPARSALPFRAGHGWRWAAIYLDLVRNVLGVEVHDRLRAAFKANRVRYTAPRKGRTLSAEERAVLVERLTRARQAAKQA